MFDYIKNVLYICDMIYTKTDLFKNFDENRSDYHLFYFITTN